MYTLALITDSHSLAMDFDMPLLLDACRARGFTAEVCEWEDPTIDWSHFDAVVLRSPWNCIECIPKFLAWCERISAVTQLFNPLSVVRWNLNKHYLADLAAHGVPVVPSQFVERGENPLLALRSFLAAHPQSRELVIKPTVGSYSRGVQRFARPMETEAAQYIAHLLGNACQVILQPYMESIDHDGETNMTYFDGVYSHAIRKSALLMPDGTVNAPLQDFRKERAATEDERAVALAALNATVAHLALEQPLLYGRVDLIRDNYGEPIVLEMEVCEPSLNLPFDEGGAMRFVQAMTNRLSLLSPA